MPKVIPIEKLEDIRNKVTVISKDSTDNEYPSAKAVYNAIGSGGGGSGDYILTEEDKQEIANIVMSNLINVSEVGQ